VSYSVAAGPLVFPDDVAGFIVECQKSAAIVADGAVEAAPSFGMVVGVGEVVHAIGAAGSDVE